MLYPNQVLIEFLTKQIRKIPSTKRGSFLEVIDSLKLCPLKVNYEDSIELIGVNEDVQKVLETFFKGKVKYIPRENSTARLMLKVLYEDKGNGLTKNDILQLIGYTEPKNSFIRPNKFKFGQWNSMKTLENNGLVVRISGKVHTFKISEDGLKLAKEIFNAHEDETCADIHANSDFSNINIKILVSENDINSFTFIDLNDIMKRVGVNCNKVDLPVGTFWFSSMDGFIFDTIIQLISVSNISNTQKIKDLSSSPFKRKIFIIIGKENHSYAQQRLKLNSEYDIETVFLESPAQVSQYIYFLSRLICKDSNSKLTFDNYVEKTVSSRYTRDVGEIWKNMLRYLPDCGPQLTSILFNLFKTPNEFREKMSSVANPEAFLEEETQRVGGRKIKQTTSRALLGIFGP